MKCGSTPLLTLMRSEATRRGRDLPMPAEVCGVFGDLYWPPVPKDVHEALEDPAFIFQSENRQVAFHRVMSEIRYFVGMRRHCWETTQVEMGVVDSVEAALDLAEEFLSGVPRSDLKAKRRPLGPRLQDPKAPPGRDGG